MSTLMQDDNGPGGLDILEQATRLVCRAPLSVLGVYCIGTMPFVLGFLYFFSHMARSPYAMADLAPASLAMALLYVWMKCWQAAYAQRLMDLVMERPGGNRTMAQTFNLAYVQVAVQPWSLLVMPVAALLTIPYGWCRAFFQNVAVLGDGRQTLGTVVRAAVEQSRIRPRQNHMVLGILVLFSLFVALNVAALLFFLPQMLKTLLGIETPFVQGFRLVLNSTFWSTVLALSYLCLDPLVKAVYVLRCFYGRSLSTGEDLLLELKRRDTLDKSLAGVLATLALAGVLLAGAPANGAQESAAQEDGRDEQTLHSVPAEALDHSLDEVLRSAKYGWRMPGEEELEREDGLLAGALETLGRGIERFFKWLAVFWDSLFPDSPNPARPRSSGGGSGFKDMLVYLGIGLAACLAAITAWRFISRRSRGEEILEPESAETDVDLASDDVRADQLPEDAWRAMAGKFFAAGENRLGLRALYLAGLAHLAQRGLVSIARFKSNREYELELARRSHAVPGVLEPFARNRLLFDRVWYGMHPATGAMVKECVANHRMLTGHAQ